MKKWSCPVFCIILAASAAAQTNGPPALEFPRWAPRVRAGGLYQFESGVEGGGELSVGRYYAEAGVGRMWSFNRLVSFSVGYGRDDYRFSGLASEPWGAIENYRAGLFARWAMENRWTLFCAPSLRFYGEEDVALDDGLSAAVFGGASYQVNESLSLGPGLGVVEQLEDDPRYFPVLLLDWQITERLSLETGGGLAATSGPGLSLRYKWNRKWQCGLSGRYESRRFRLNESNPIPNGVGEEQGTLLVLDATYVFFPGSEMNLFVGQNFGGQLELNDKNGHTLAQTDYDSAPLIGFSAKFAY